MDNNAKNNNEKDNDSITNITKTDEKVQVMTITLNISNPVIDNAFGWYFVLENIHGQRQSYRQWKQFKKVDIHNLLESYIPLYHLHIITAYSPS